MTDVQSYQLSEKLLETARRKHMTVATAESCTGGWIGKCLTDIPGSSDVFRGGIIAYSNAVKEQMLDVPRDTLIQHGAVSHETAFYMAKNAATRFEADLCISVTGIAGPGGGSDAKPTGLVYMGFCLKGEVNTEEFRFLDKGRDSIRRQALEQALNRAIQLIEIN